MEKLSQDTPNKDMMDFSFDDIIDSNIFDNNNDEPLWDKLIQQIIDGNVIPVIGADLLIDNSSNLHKFIMDGLARTFGVSKQVNSFSELVYAPEYKNKFKLDNIYYQVDKIFAAKRFPASERLRRLLSIRQFPFIITTSFTPVIEQAMQNIWKDELRVMKFNNNPSENSDIKNGADLRKPTIYYMFGKVGAGAHKYVLTDIDLLDLDVLAVIDHNITVNVIKDGEIVAKKDLILPKEIRNVFRCKNPRCITSIEQELPHVFFLADESKEVYRCLYCEEKVNKANL